jgi:glycosyltransferase involved in cell wall biosynthesis
MKAEQKQILFHASSTFGIGGAQVRFATLANKHKSLFSHLLFAMDRNYDAIELLDPKINFEIRNFSYDKGNIARNFVIFRRALKELQPDLLITYNWGAIEWALANLGKTLPHIHIVDGFGPEEADRQLARRVNFRRLVFWRNTTVVVPSHTLFDIATRIWRISPAKVVYIPNGIDCDRFTGARDRALADRYGIDAESTVIGTVATLRPEKNLERLILAFRDLPRDTKLQLLIVGDGSKREALESFAKEQGVSDRVIFPGYISDPAAILSLFDIFAISSDTEQMPISILEAMASGLPVAGVDVGDVRHMVSDANKPYIVERDTDALSAILAKFVSEPSLRRSIGDENRRHVREVYEEKTMVDAYARLFSRGMES